MITWVVIIGKWIMVRAADTRLRPYLPIIFDATEMQNIAGR